MLTYRREGMARSIDARSAARHYEKRRRLNRLGLPRPVATPALAHPVRAAAYERGTFPH